MLQGAPFVTLDVDLWIGLPARSYMRVINLCQALGARLHSPTAVILPGEHIINFLYEVTGLKSFHAEVRSAQGAVWHGVEVRLLPVERIIKSKEALQRPKDLVHLPELRRLLAAQKLVGEAPNAN